MGATATKRKVSVLACCPVRKAANSVIAALNAKIPDTLQPIPLLPPNTPPSVSERHRKGWQAVLDAVTSLEREPVLKTWEVWDGETLITAAGAVSYEGRDR